MSTSLSLEGVSQAFRQGRTEVQVVADVSVSLAEAEVVCLVGESGCGKSTTGRIAAGLLRPTSGRVLYDGHEVWQLRGKAYAEFRRAVQMVHQDPYASLNPVLTIYDAMSAPLLKHGFAKNRTEARRRAIELLELTDLTPAAEILDKYPHQLSGGQRQRVSVARALTVNPRFIIADEAVSMVDVSIRASLLNMLVRLNQQMGVSFLFITHDLALARYFAIGGRIAVMYLGRIVEVGPTEHVIQTPTHPYTQALLSAVPEADPDITRSKQRLELRSYEIPSLVNLPPGCSFHPRCPAWVAGLCDTTRPELTPLPDGRLTACHVAVGSPDAARPVVK